MTVDSTLFSTEQELVEKALRAALEGDTMVPRLRDAVRYAVFPGGKRLRPMLALGLCSDLGGDSARIINGAAALELLHCSSLVHDDLPTLDNDDMRRGKPSCHCAFGEATALLAGDIAISEAIGLALRVELEMSGVVAVAGEVSRAYSELCNGQQLDLLPQTERGDVLNLYARKTGALFGAAFAIGAIGAERESDFVDSARRFGVQLGVLFQLHDDQIDGRPEKGRAAASDCRNQKATATITENPCRFEDLRVECLAMLESIEQRSIEQRSIEQGSSPLTRVRSLIGSLLFAG